jgi:hypothetical protein
LAAAFRDDAGESGEWRHVGQFVQRQQQARTFGLSVVGGVDQLFDESDDEGCGDGLVPAGCDDVELVGTAQELPDVEWRLSRRGPSGFGAHPGEETRRRRPDTGTFAFFGRQDAAQERHRGVMFAVTIVEFVYEVLAASLVNS